MRQIIPGFTTVHLHFSVRQTIPGLVVIVLHSSVRQMIPGFETIAFQRLEWQNISGLETRLHFSVGQRLPQNYTMVDGSLQLKAKQIFRV